MNATPEDIGKKMDALALWDDLIPYNWIIKPRGTVFPYFCAFYPGDGKLVRARLLLLEGWQTFHDFAHVRVDRWWGFYSIPAEMPHFELLILTNGETRVFRNDPVFAPRPINDKERPIVTKIAWEVYGVMMRVENDKMLPLRYANEKAMFARVETADGVWEDRPMEIPPPPPSVEKVSFRKDILSKAKDLPIINSLVIELDFHILPGVVTTESPHRTAYELIAIDEATGTTLFSAKASPSQESGLKDMWESLAPQILLALINLGKVPGEIKVISGRVFRMVRPLCMELPFKLSLHDKLKYLKEIL